VRAGPVSGWATWPELPQRARTARRVPAHRRKVDTARRREAARSTLSPRRSLGARRWRARAHRPSRRRDRCLLQIRRLLLRPPNAAPLREACPWSTPSPVAGGRFEHIPGIPRYTKSSSYLEQLSQNATKRLAPGALIPVSVQRRRTAGAEPFAKAPRMLELGRRHATVGRRTHAALSGSPAVPPSPSPAAPWVPSVPPLPPLPVAGQPNKGHRHTPFTQSAGVVAPGCPQTRHTMSGGPGHVFQPTRPAPDASLPPAETPPPVALEPLPPPVTLVPPLAPFWVAAPAESSPRPPVERPPLVPLPLVPSSSREMVVECPAHATTSATTSNPGENARPTRATR
jgi:hypothetical protein